MGCPQSGPKRPAPRGSWQSLVLFLYRMQTPLFPFLSRYDLTFLVNMVPNSCGPWVEPDMFRMGGIPFPNSYEVARELLSWTTPSLDLRSDCQSPARWTFSNPSVSLERYCLDSLAGCQALKAGPLMFTYCGASVLTFLAHHIYLRSDMHVTVARMGCVRDAKCGPRRWSCRRIKSSNGTLTI